MQRNSLYREKEMIKMINNHNVRTSKAIYFLLIENIFSLGRKFIYAWTKKYFHLRENLFTQYKNKFIQGVILFSQRVIKS